MGTGNGGTERLYEVDAMVNGVAVPLAGAMRTLLSSM